eukprot:TRINITY_DN73577_c0_g1_i1.p1 TRINITY_DN73577_c0_g1~~TRINITY_DN73577_c0_g1_i1.p1  ORF type:complete len:304 (-),score=52.40 TRINITY_DN73577_c0_g1_i1:45-956(-)
MLRLRIFSTAFRYQVQLRLRVRTCASAWLAVDGPNGATRLSWYLLPAVGAIGISRVLLDRASVATACQSAGDLEASDFAAARGVVRMLATRTGVDSDAFMRRSRDAYMRAAGSHAVLGQAEVDHAMRELAVMTKVDEETLLKMGPLLFRLLDADRDGTVTLKEFLMGQALLFAAAHAGGAAELGELCWRALDVDGDGTVTRSELDTAVHLMLEVGAIDPEDLQRIKQIRNEKSQIARAMKQAMGRGSSGYVSLRSEAVRYYMSMYDTNGDGKISRQEFMRCSALQNNFLRLLRTESAKPIFLA